MIREAMLSFLAASYAMGEIQKMHHFSRDRVVVLILSREAHSDRFPCSFRRETISTIRAHVSSISLDDDRIFGMA